MKKKNKYKTLYVFMLCVLLLSISDNAFAQSKGLPIDNLEDTFLALIEEDNLKRGDGR